MRIVKEITHPQYKITVFSWNTKYLIKMERGLIEQTYKVPETELSGDQEIEKLISKDFMDKVLARFDEMESDLVQALEDLYH